MPRATLLVVLCGAAVLTLSMGIRQSFGLFMAPITEQLAMSRETFALALALQNVIWGLAQPFAGILADRFGSARVLLTGAACYVAGLLVMGGATDALGVHLGAGVLIGMAMSATSFAVVLGAVGRLAAPERRGQALGIASAGGSFGQFVMAPVGQEFIAGLGWSGALFAMAGLALLMVPLAQILKGRPATEAGQQTISGALREAGGHPGYRYLTAGFFVCGFQVVFVAVHLPAYITDIGLDPKLAATALALIGFFNIIGTWGCGVIADRYSKRYSLAILYVVRSVVIATFLLLPKSELSVLVFASALGLLWLGTVPLTSGLVAQIFGPRYLATLFSIVFFSHQVGSFLGAWLGGVVYDRTGSYDIIWIATIVLGLVAAALHLPISERPLRAEAQAAGG